MRRHLLLALAAVLVLGFAASSARAACDFEHPKKAKKFQGSFVQAFVSCGNPGGNSPNTTTEGGVPTCQPPETFNEQAGNPASGWRWDEGAGAGTVAFKASNKPLVVPPNNVLNPPGDTTDLAVAVKLKGVLDAAGPASGTGALATVARATLDDRAGGSMTVIDFPANFTLPLAAGAAKVKTSADALLNGIGQPGLPPCTSIETVSVTVLDENGNTFANLGVYLPEL